MIAISAKSALEQSLGILLHQEEVDDELVLSSIQGVSLYVFCKKSIPANEIVTINHAYHMYQLLADRAIQFIFSSRPHKTNFNTPILIYRQHSGIEIQLTENHSNSIATVIFQDLNPISVEIINDPGEFFWWDSDRQEWNEP